MSYGSYSMSICKQRSRIVASLGDIYEELNCTYMTICLFYMRNSHI